MSFHSGSEVIIEETSENTDVIENTKEYAKLINVKYLPFVKSSLEILSKLPGRFSVGWFHSFFHSQLFCSC